MVYTNRTFYLYENAMRYKYIVLNLSRTSSVLHFLCVHIISTQEVLEGRNRQLINNLTRMSPCL